MGICDSSSNKNANPRHTSISANRSQTVGEGRETMKYFMENTTSTKQDTLILNNDVIVSDSGTDPEKVYQKVKLIGEGAFGEVWQVRHKALGKDFAMKIIEKSYNCKPKEILNEINILKQLDNINIMKLHEVIKTDKFNYLIMEYIDGISLLEIIKNEKKHYLEEKRALKIFIQIVKAIEYCQSKNICHRDIKLENILTLKNDIIKLIDFGFAVKTNKETFQTLLCGSPSYMAPEIVKKEKYIAQYSDIWSLGVLLYSMLFGRFPFKGKTQKELFESIKKCEVEFPEEIKVSD